MTTTLPTGRKRAGHALGSGEGDSDEPRQDHEPSENDGGKSGESALTTTANHCQQPQTTANGMPPRTFTHFDPDAISAAARTHIVVSPAPMLSEVIAANDWHGDSDDSINDVSQAASLPLEKGIAQPLSKRQKWVLSDLADSVYHYLRDAGELKGENLINYRHRIAIKACGVRISQASHGHFKLIQAAFLKERGRAEQARRALAQAAATPHAIAVYKLWELCKNTNTPRSAAFTIAARFYKGATIDQLTARQVWGIFYTIQNNANAAAGKGQAGNRFKSLKAKQGRKHA